MTVAQVRAQIAGQLGIDPDGIGDDADLIGLGLDSIRMMKLAGGWRKAGHQVNFAQLAADPRPVAWAALLGGESLEPAADAAALAHTVPSPHPEDGEPFPLAPMQHAYWVGRTGVADLGGVAAHLYVEFDDPGSGAGESGAADLDPARLAAAARALVAAHPMLRAQFLDDGTQRILPELGREPLTVVDLRDRGEAAVAAELAALRERKGHQLLDIADGEVFDLTLTLLPGGRHRLHFDIDMLAADAMSYRTLLRDLVAAYDGALLAPAEFGYRDYLRHRAEHPNPAVDADRRWWAERLDTLPAGPSLPKRLRGSADAGAPEDGQQRTARLNHWIDADAKARLLAGAYERGLTPASALAAVFAATIGAWSADERFLLNVPLFHRDPVHPDVERLSGDFSSSVLLDVDVSGGGSVAELARDVQSRLHENGAHSGYGALDVLRDLGRSRGETVLAPVVYTSALGLGELFAPPVLERLGEPVWIVSQGPQVLLDAQVTEHAGGLLLNWDVRIDEFPPGVVEEMFAQYTAALDRLASSPAGWLAQAAPELPAAQRAVRAAVNDTAAAVTGRLLHEEFFTLAGRGAGPGDPDRTALLWRDGALTYGELARQALAVAGALAAAGIAPGDSVGVQIPKGYRQVVATLGVFAAGATWVPISYDQPAARRATILDTGSIAALITDGDVDTAAVSVPVLTLDDALAHALAPEPHFGDPEDIAYVLFTSGSTGTPKGVEVPHRAAMNTIDDVNARFGVGPADRSLTVAALEFDISVYDIFGLYSAGGAVVAVGLADAKDPAAWRDLLITRRASVLTCVPSALDMLLTIAEGGSGSGSGGGLGDSLKAVLLGGDWVGVDLPGRLARQAPGARFAGLGGATEIAIHGTVCEVAEPPAHWQAVPFGTPLRNVACRVVSRRGADRPDWVTGELWVGGAGVAAGYRGDPERTAERFVDHEGRRWYRTGDLARYWPDGTVEFLGRADHQVKIRGFRVELGEVEGALRSVPGVRHAVATVVVQAGTVQAGSGALAAAVAGTATPERIRDDLAALLPGYMIPAHIMVFDELPLTGNGKLDRAAIGAALVSGDTGAVTEPPRSDLERALLAIVEEVLRAEPGTIGVTDDFFAAGGDSVLATAVIARVRDWLDAPQAGVADIFAARTVAALGERLDRADSTAGRLEQVAAIYLEVSALDEFDDAGAGDSGTVTR